MIPTNRQPQPGAFRRPRPISGGSSSNDENLRRQIRARLLEARLPAVNGVSRSHRGSGRPCIVCGRAIEATEVERQVGGFGVLLFAHEVCYKLWREESVAHRTGVTREAPSGEEDGSVP